MAPNAALTYKSDSVRFGILPMKSTTMGAMHTRPRIILARVTHQELSRLNQLMKHAERIESTL